MPKARRGPTHAVNLKMPKRLHEAAVLCADTIGQSLTQFITQATAQRIRNWKDPVTGDPVVTKHVEESPYEDWVCYHGSHSGAQPAIECRHRSSTHKKSFASDSYPHVTWAEFNKGLLGEEEAKSDE